MCNRATILAAACGALALGARPGPLLAAPPSQPTLEWRDDGRCPDDGRTLRQALILADHDSPGASARHFVVVLETGEQGQQAVELREDRGQPPIRRKLELPDCARAREAIALLIALTLNPNAATPPADARKGAEAPRADAPRTDAPDAPGPSDATPAAPPPRATRELRWGVGIRGLGSVGPLPGPSPGLGLAIQLRVGPVAGPGRPARTRLVLGADYLAPQAEPLPAPDAALQVGLWRALFGAYHLWPIGQALSVGPFATFSVGRLHAASRNIARPGRAGALWLAPALGGAASIALGPTELRLSAGASLPLRRPRLLLDSLGQVHRVPAVALDLALALFVSL